MLGNVRVEHERQHVDCGSAVRFVERLLLCDPECDVFGAEAGSEEHYFKPKMYDVALLGDERPQAPARCWRPDVEVQPHRAGLRGHVT